MRSTLRRCNFLSHLQSPQPAGGSQARQGCLPVGYPTGDEPHAWDPPSFTAPHLPSPSRLAEHTINFTTSFGRAAPGVITQR